MSETKTTTKRVRVKRVTPAVAEAVTEADNSITALELQALDSLLEQWPAGKSSLVLEPLNEDEERALELLAARGLVVFTPPIIEGGTALVSRPEADADAESLAFSEKYSKRLDRVARKARRT